MCLLGQLFPSVRQGPPSRAPLPETLLLYKVIGPPRWQSGEESACQEGDVGLIPGLGRSPEGGNGNPLQYSCLRNAWTEKPGG